MSWKPGDRIFRLEAIRAELDGESWEPSVYDETVEERCIYLGTVFSLCPSGKHYLPFACSNVDACPVCKGKGTVLGHHKASVRRRNKARYERMMRTCMKRGADYARAQAGMRNAAKNRWEKTCPHCMGVGSREAYLDDCWHGQANSELSYIGCHLTSSEGDPCDLLVCEVRNVTEVEDDAAE